MILHMQADDFSFLGSSLKCFCHHSLILAAFSLSVKTKEGIWRDVVCCSFLCNYSKGQIKGHKIRNYFYSRSSEFIQYPCLRNRLKFKLFTNLNIYSISLGSLLENKQSY